MNYAFVLGGGGGKGAYEIGVWKALCEMGYANRFSCVIGTSVGALNGALFCQKKLETAERIWLEDLSQETILRLNLNLKGIRDRFHSGVPPAGLFSQDGLNRLLEENLPDVMPDNPLFYVCTSKIAEHDKNPDIFQTLLAEEGYIAEYVKMNAMPRQKAIPFLMASAALPVIYSPVHVRRDGGMLAQNNVPYHEAVRMGYEKILAVSLGNKTLAFLSYGIEEARRGTSYEKEPVPTENGGVSDVFILCPTVSLGGLFNGTLDFSASGAKRRMDLGYQNCMGTYRKYIDLFFSDIST